MTSKLQLAVWSLFLLSLSACHQPPQTAELEKKRISASVDSLVAQMTIDEKIGQMTQIDMRMIDDISDIGDLYIGSILSGGGSVPSDNSPKGWVNMVNEFQKQALSTRLKIPLIYGIDAVHGHNNVVGATIFPHNLALGCANDNNLVYRVNQATATEVAATGIHWTFAPCIAVPQDPRWGRFYEGFGDNTALVNGLTAAAIEGFENPLSKIENRQIAGCAKHFIGDGATTFGSGTRVEGIHTYYLDRGDAAMTEAEMREKYLPPYITAIASGVKTVMMSFNSFNGEKCHGSSYLIQDLLKGELGFEGFIISDWAGIDEIPGDYKSDIINGVNAGIDMVMVPGNLFGQEHYKTFITLFKEAVAEGSIKQERLDDAVRRILTVKYQIGLFDEPYMSDQFTAEVGSKEHRELAREAVQKSTVVLKNSNNILPLSKADQITVAGSAANNLGMQNGGWTVEWQGHFMPDFNFLDDNADGRISDSEYLTQISLVYGSKFDAAMWSGRFGGLDTNADKNLSAEEYALLAKTLPYQPSGTSILHGLEGLGSAENISYKPNAKDIAQGQTIIAVVGEYPYAEGYGDDPALQLNAYDTQVLERAFASGNRVIVVMVSGRPLNMDSHFEKAAAVVGAFWPGMAGEGVADVIYGDFNPTARLSFTWYRELGLDNSSKLVLFDFGSGLSY